MREKKTEKRRGRLSSGGPENLHRQKLYRVALAGKQALYSKEGKYRTAPDRRIGVQIWTNAEAREALCLLGLVQQR